MNDTANPLAQTKLSTPELVGMVACLMALNALAIDIMLPAMSEIGTALGIEKANDAQQIIVIYMLGFGFSQLFIGPLTDRYGRRKTLLVALVGYVLFSLGCILSQDFQTMLIWRFALGIAAGGTRVVAVSVVRDLFVGRSMARIMSLVMTVFMVIPIIAPIIGQGILYFAHWQGIFGVLAFGGGVMLLWSWARLPETRPPEDCTPIDLKFVASAYFTVFKTPVALGHMLASGVIFGALFAFISASEQIFNEVLDAEDTFVLWFALVALAMSAANFMNAKIVEQVGMRRISHAAVIGFTVFSVILLASTYAFGPNLYVFITLFCIIFGFFGFMGPNFNALAMEPLGKIAGTASALLGFASTTMAATIGGLIGAQYNGSLMPVLWGYVGLGAVTFVILLVTEKGKLFSSR